MVERPRAGACVLAGLPAAPGLGPAPRRSALTARARRRRRQLFLSRPQAGALSASGRAVERLYAGLVARVSAVAEEEAWVVPSRGDQAAPGPASAAPRTRQAATQETRGGARPRGGGGPAVGGEWVCACAAGPAPLLPPGRPRRRVNGGLGGGGGLSGSGLGCLEQPWPRRRLSGRREAFLRLFSRGRGLGLCVVARGGRWRGSGAAGALRRVPGTPAAGEGAATAALLALGL